MRVEVNRLRKKRKKLSGGFILLGGQFILFTAETRRRGEKPNHRHRFAQINADQKKGSGERNPILRKKKRDGATRGNDVLLKSVPMACRGVLFAITAEETGRLKAAQGDDAKVLNIVQEEIEAAWDAEHLCETDKAWDAIHRCLTEGKLGFGRVAYPRNLCILGGEQLHKGADYIVSLLAPDQVKDVSEALKPITQEWFRARYSEIDPEEYGVPLSDEDFDYTWHWFHGVRQFYQKAASEGRWTIFTVDQ